MPFDTQTQLDSPSDATLNLYVRRPAATPKGVIQVNHGLAEHAARYARFADFTADRGFATYAHDHRGHGHTKAPDAPPGVFASRGGADKVIADVLAVQDRIAGDHPGVPLIVFGHSMGGLVALNALLRQPERASAAAIWNANFTAGLLGQAAKMILAWERFRLGSDVPSRILPKLTFQAWAKQIPDRRTEFDWLSGDPDEVDKYIADPLCGWDASVGMWRDLFDLVFHGANDRNFSGVAKSLPLNLAGGEKDPATDGGKAVTALSRRMATMGFSNLETTIYAETRHESLNEVNRDMIMEQFTDWAERAVAAR